MYVLDVTRPAVGLDVASTARFLAEFLGEVRMVLDERDGMRHLDAMTRLAERLAVARAAGLAIGESIVRMLPGRVVVHMWQRHTVAVDAVVLGVAGTTGRHVAHPVRVSPLRTVRHSPHASRETFVLGSCVVTQIAVAIRLHRGMTLEAATHLGGTRPGRGLTVRGRRVTLDAVGALRTRRVVDQQTLGGHDPVEDLLMAVDARRVRYVRSRATTFREKAQGHAQELARAELDAAGKVRRDVARLASDVRVRAGLGVGHQLTGFRVAACTVRRSRRRDADAECGHQQDTGDRQDAEPQAALEHR
jgi:hypothetical protein